MLKKLLATGFLSLCCLSLSSCNFINVDTESLMRPPKLSALQTQIDEALKSALGTRDITLKYPLSGNYRSAFVFHNLDGDEQDEALVFYQQGAGENAITRINILDQRPDGSWSSVFDVAGGGSDVQSILFAPISTKEKDDVVISWNQQGKDNQNVVVYSYGDRQLKTLFSGTANTFYTVDSNEDGYDELLLFNKGGTREPSIQLVRRVGRQVITRSEELLNSKLTDFANITFGKVASGQPAVFIDEVIDSETVATEVVLLDDRKPVNLMRPDEEGEEELFLATYRSAGVSCRLNEDGTVDIPTQSLLPGYTLGQESEPIYLTNYNSIDAFGNLTSSSCALINQDMGYTLDLPSTWRGNITVRRSHENGEWRFVFFQNSLANSETELLRIRVTSHRDYQDKFETDNYFSLAKKGIFEYDGFIPDNNHPLRITEEELRGMFRLNN